MHHATVSSFGGPRSTSVKPFCHGRPPPRSHRVQRRTSFHLTMEIIISGDIFPWRRSSCYVTSAFQLGSKNRGIKIDLMSDLGFAFAGGRLRQFAVTRVMAFSHVQPK